jgi:hypothetical protein
MKLIKLTQGKFAKIDDIDFDVINKWKWRFNSRVGAVHRIYLEKINGKWKFEEIIMHRFLLNASKDKQVDHKNRDILDNQRSNLRICTPSENNCNKLVMSKNKSGFKGVLWEKLHKKYRAVIAKNKKIIYLGYFDTPQKAALAYNEAAKKLHGEFAVLNKI